MVGTGTGSPPSGCGEAEVSGELQATSMKLNSKMQDKRISMIVFVFSRFIIGHPRPINSNMSIGFSVKSSESAQDFNTGA